MSEARVVFLGTGEIAIPAFRWLIEHGPKPVALVTQPDRPAGRKRELKPPPIKVVAQEAGMPVLQPEKIRDAGALAELAGLKPDLIVVMAYGQILPQRLIDLPRLGCVNLHASLLPKYRGAACIQAAIDAGDAETGVTLMDVVRELDAGDVILAKRTPIRPDDTGGSLHDRLAEVARDVLAEGLAGLLDGTAERVPQAALGESSHVRKLERDEGRIDWSWSAEGIGRRLRAYDPWPGCWTTWAGDEGEQRLKIFPQAEMRVGAAASPGEILESDGELRVACGDGWLALAEVQPENGRRMRALDWWRGVRGVRRLR